MNKEKIKDKFVKYYVNNVYAIILGLGFQEIVKNIFPSETSSHSALFGCTNYFHALMSFFIIIVVCLNWWDWSAKFGDQVESTFLEFIIDLFILFTLLMMFFRFDDSLELIKLFFILSFLELVWVVNHYRKKQKISIYLNILLVVFKEHINSLLRPEINRKFRKNLGKQDKDGFEWISKKILALFLYGLAWYSCLKISKYLIIQYNYTKDMMSYGFLVSIPIFVTFFLARSLCTMQRT